MARTITKKTYLDHDKFVERMKEVEADDAIFLVSAMHVGYEFVLETSDEDAPVVVEEVTPEFTFTEPVVPAFSTVRKKAPIFGLSNASNDNRADWLLPSDTNYLEIQIARGNGKVETLGTRASYTRGVDVPGLPPGTWMYDDIGGVSSIYYIDYVIEVDRNDSVYSGKLYPNGQ